MESAKAAELAQGNGKDVLAAGQPHHGRRWQTRRPVGASRDLEEQQECLAADGFQAVPVIQRHLIADQRLRSNQGRTKAAAIAAASGNRSA